MQEHSGIQSSLHSAKNWFQTLIQQTTCFQGQNAIFICTNEDCASNAFICSNGQCNCKTIQHNQCNKVISIEKFVTIIKHQKIPIPTALVKKFDQVIQHYDNIIEKLSEDRNQFMQYINMFGLSKLMQKAVKLVSQDRMKQINGQLTGSIIKQIDYKQDDVYFPELMNNQIDIQYEQSLLKCLLNSIANQLAVPSTKIKASLSKFNCKAKLNTEYLRSLHKHYQFIPAQINQFTKLLKLNLRFNHIYHINNLNSLTQLLQLDLRWNKIRKIQNLSKLLNMRELYLNGNKIQKIQNLDSNLNLQKLGLGGNKISKIENLDYLINLRQLYLQINEITKIENIDMLANLEDLALDNNQISILENIFNLPKLKTLYIHHNPLLQEQIETFKIEELRCKKINVRVENDEA